MNENMVEKYMLVLHLFFGILQWHIKANTSHRLFSYFSSKIASWSIKPELFLKTKRDSDEEEMERHKNRLWKIVEQIVTSLSLQTFPTDYQTVPY